MNKNITKQRKLDHIQISLGEDVSSSITTGLEKVSFIHQALPEISFDEIETSINFLGKTLSFPLLISSMTGGTRKAARMNQNLATAAENLRIGFAVGSQRAAIEDPALAKTYAVRDFAPQIPVLANLGAIQLNYGFNLNECKRAIEMVRADGLILHLNPLQEALQQEGNTNFRSLINKIEIICRELKYPVIVKEVGFGISEQVARMLSGSGVWGVDVAGGGGTSWSQVEKFRAKKGAFEHVAEAFRDWGIPTMHSISNLKSFAPNIKIIASGGLRSGVDMAKCVALGADMCGIALPLLKAADVSIQAVENLISQYFKQFKIAMFAAGAENLKKLSRLKLVERG
jgi:isopentenyl-diphosphate delta-isomerase